METVPPGTIVEPTVDTTSDAASARATRGPGRPRHELSRPPETLEETYAVLLSRTGRKPAPIPAETLVHHVLRITAEADWPVRKEAMDAVLRRLSAAKDERLRVASRPGRKTVLGAYATRRPRAEPRPYRTVLRGLSPLDGSCDCPDFLRNSLGLCKHLIAVLIDAFSRPRLLATSTTRDIDPSVPPCDLCWDPIRELTGPGDPLERVVWHNGAEAGHRDGAGPPAAIRRWFHRADDGSWRLKDALRGNRNRRLQLVTAVLDHARASGNGPNAQGATDPALAAILAAEKEKLARVLDDDVDLAVLHRVLKSLKQRLYPYQVEGVRRFFASGRLLLADDMGLGKTAQAIACCHALWGLRRVRRGLLIVPSSLKPQWLREWQLFTSTPVALVEGPQSDRRQAFRASRSGFLIINYEQLLRDFDVVRAWNPDVVVLDEAQRIKNWATKSAAYVKALAPRCRLVLTGTPMENRISELASILDWVDDTALEPKWRLVPWHTVFTDGRHAAGGARHLDTLRERLSGSMLRRVRQEVLKELPARTDTRVPVELTAEQRERHDLLRSPISRLLTIARSRPLSQAEFLKLMTLLTMQRMISNGLAQVDFVHVWPEVANVERPSDELLRSLSTPKLIEVRELITNLAVAQGRKVVVFSQWRRMLELAHWAVRGVLASAGLRAVFFTGQEKQARRTQNLVDLHDDPDTRVLFASDAGGVGLNLQRAATACVNMELPWNPAVLEQRIGRIWRLGQRHPIDVYNLVTEEGIEARIAGLVGTKRAFFTGLFDGGTDSVAFESSGSFLETVGRLIAPAGAPPPAPIEAEAHGDPESDSASDAAIDACDEGRDGPPADDDSAGASARADAIDATRDRPAAVGNEPPAAHDLFARLRVHRKRDGRVLIEAPPETAKELASLFAGMARLMGELGAR